MQINQERLKIQNEALHALEKHNYNGIFLLPTGTGKSYVLITALKRLLEAHPEYQNIWYICNSTDLRDKDFDAELDKWDATDLKARITKMCYQTAYKLKDQAVDVVLADEFDYSLTPEYFKVYQNNEFTHKILTTAYIEGKTKMDMALKVAPVVYQQSLQQVEDKKVLNKSEYFYVTYPLSAWENDQYLRHNERITQLLGELKQYQIMKDKRGIALLEHKLKMTTMARKHFLNSLESSAFYTRKLMQEIYQEDPKCKILTFCELTDQADRVCKYSYHGKNTSEDNLTRFRQDEIQALSVCGKVNRGVNIPGVRYIIHESCSQSKTALTQRLGRGKRLNVDEHLKVFFMIPTYKTIRGDIRYTKIIDWILNAAGNLDLRNASVYKFKT